MSAEGVDAPLTLCDTTVDATLFSSPRIEAGGGDQAPVNGVGPEVVGFTDDRLDCETMPIDDFVYARRGFDDVFTDAQQAALRATYPTGVCDYSKRGTGFQAAVPWLRYQDDAGAVVYGGAPMGDPPLSIYFGPVATTGSTGGTLPATGGRLVPVAAVTLLVAALGLRRSSRLGR